MADTLQLELVSPERLLMSEQVEMVTIPGTDGYFGVLPQHAPVISSLRPGVIDVYVDGVVAQQYFVGGGFAEVNAKGVTVLVDEALVLKDVTKALAELRREAAMDLIDDAKTDAERKHAATALKIAEELAALAAKAGN
ncbi:MAG: ATP synthase F1 subunit epsilon [Rhodobacteraceae bacterium]|nr:ATP synthase F1 subunit epsilon [Paracoccaceae bacterium]